MQLVVNIYAEMMYDVTVDTLQKVRVNQTFMVISSRNILCYIQSGGNCMYDFWLSVHLYAYYVILGFM